MKEKCSRKTQNLCKNADKCHNIYHNSTYFHKSIEKQRFLSRIQNLLRAYFFDFVYNFAYQIYWQRRILVIIQNILVVKACVVHNLCRPQNKIHKMFDMRTGYTLSWVSVYKQTLPNVIFILFDSYQLTQYITNVKKNPRKSHNTKSFRSMI